MSAEKPRLSRLTAILLQLQSSSLVTAPILANKFKVSVRTIYRDIRTLEQSGVPIITEEGKGYSLMPGYKLPPVMFTEQEANALITAEQLIVKNKDTSLVAYYQNAILKIKSILNYNQKQKIDLLTDRVYFLNNYAQEQTSNYLIEIQTALTNFKVIDITYTSLEEQTTYRCIEPFALYSTKDNWILIAYCRLRKSFRNFRIDCIEELHVKEEFFESHNMSLEAYYKKYVTAH